MAYRVLKIAAFSDGKQGGNPAGVVIEDELPTVPEMQSIAAEIGYSETVFAAPFENNTDHQTWRVRYFSPQSEVPFCGHATIALGAALALRYGDNEYSLRLNAANITVSGKVDGDVIKAALQSPPTKSALAPPALVGGALQLFGYTHDDLDPRLPPAIAHGGADHLILALKTREALRAMDYDLERGRELMNKYSLVTIAFVVAETSTVFHARNAFASGGVLEDPATGAAAAALSGYLRDVNWPHNGGVQIIQGEDMNMRSLLHAEITDTKNSSIRISGTARMMDKD